MAETRASTGRVIALDVGGTSMKGAIVEPDHTFEQTFRWPTPRAAGPDAVVAAVLDAVDQLRSKAPDARAIGIVVPGFVDDSTGVALYSENIKWRDVPFRRLVEERTGLPVGFGHDVRAGGLAEHTLGASRGVKDVLFMPIGTGISGAMYIDGTLNNNMLGGEIGHLDIGSGLLCACGAIGCLETVATGPSIARRYNELTGLSVLGSQPVVERLAMQDPDAAAVWQSAVDAIAHALVSYVTLLSPELIVIGGGLSKAGAVLLDPLRIAVRERIVWQKLPRIELAALGDESACLGAALLAELAGP